MSKMTNKEALEVLTKYNAWRRNPFDTERKTPPEGWQLVNAIDVAIKALEKETGAD